MSKLALQAISFALLGFGLSVLLVLGFGTIVINGSESLKANAFVVFDFPPLRRKGSIVAAKMPDVLADSYPDFFFVKEIRGLPGDVIEVNGTNVCIDRHCVQAQIKNGQVFSPLIEPGVIPSGHYAVFGTSQASLDSRYAVVGLLAEDDIIAAGFQVPFPEWKVLAGWLDR